MATTFQEHFDQGANGTPLSIANTNFSSVENPPVFSTSVKKAGTGSMYVTTTGSYSYALRSFTSSTRRYWSFYLRPAAAPSANTVVLFVGTSQADTDRVFQVTLNTDRTVKVQQGASAIILGSATASACPLNQWSRIDVSYVNGAITCDLYPGTANCDDATGSASTGNGISGSVAGVGISSLHLGVGNGSTNQLYFDEFSESDSALPGPVNVSPPASFQEHFDQGANGVNLSSSNTNFDSAVNAPVFSTSVKKAGAGSMNVTTAGSYSFVTRSFSATTKRYWSFYLRPAATPSANTVMFFVGTSQADADRIFQVTLNTDLSLKVQQGASAIILGSATASACPLNQWSRIDVSYIGGAISCHLYPGTSNCDDATDSASTGNKIGGNVTSATISSLHLGVGNNTSNQLYFDEFIESESGIPGPVGGGIPLEPYLYYDNGSAWVDVTENLYYDNGVAWASVEAG